MGRDFVSVHVAALSQERPRAPPPPSTLRTEAHEISEFLAQNTAKQGAVDIAATQRGAHFQPFQLVFL